MAKSSIRRWSLFMSDYWPPSLNKTQMAHWTTVRKHKRHALDLLFVNCLAQHGGIPHFKGRAHVELHRIIGHLGKRMDVDNLNGSVKVLVDALRRRKEAGKSKEGGLGIIVDDDDSHLDLLVTQAPYASRQISVLLKALGYPDKLYKLDPMAPPKPNGTRRSIGELTDKPPTSTLIVIRGRMGIG